jgi:hypothetical protein
MTARRVPADHATHDLLLIAAHVAGDTSVVESGNASEQLAVCAECRQVAADLAAIAAASRGLPPPHRTRDFRLTAEQAARLRNRSPWARLTDALLAPRGFGRAMPAALMTLGFAALMITVLPGLPSMGSPASRQVGEQAIVSPSSAPTAVDFRNGIEAAPRASAEPAKDALSASHVPNLAPPAVGGAAASPAGGRTSTPLPAAQGPGGGPTSDGATDSAASGSGGAERAASQGPPPIGVLAVLLIASGLALLIARRLAPRSAA